ncbi:MAG TPA: multidrug transporter [Barnesiella intestinihominis]|uniref:TolC family protein n=1 Tax=Barnesiella intestinihominis TaxID=487174 RepID=UPI000E9A2B0C|nr:TolC family protein [Barnesiella intestinihominis]HBI65904.1 multidrug transporter [Barnesiella intestinihominis]HCP42088.1 multidrug transporter [Barnesiella intestinihominis]
MKRIIIGLLLLTGLSGCHIYRTYERPELSGVDSLYRVPAMTEDTMSLADFSWKELFTDTVLQQLIEKGIANNTDLNIARLKVREAEALLTSSKLAYLPSVSLTPQGTIKSIEGNSPTKTYNLAASADWELDIFGRLTNAKREAKAVLEQSQAYKQAVQTQLIATIANSYYTLLMLDKQLDISRRTAEIWAENLRVMKALKKAGQTTEMAVAQIEASKLSVDASLLSLEQQITEVENSLSSLLGVVPQRIDRSTLDMQSFPDTLSVGVPLQLLQRRPDVRQSEAALAEAFYTTNRAYSAFYPAITLSGSAGWTNAAGAIISNPGEWLFSAVGSLVQPFFNRGQNIANLKVAKARQEEALLTFRQTLLNAGTEVNDALLQWQVARRRLDLDRQQIISLQSAVRSSELLMRHSSQNYLEVLTARQTLLDAELSAVSDRFEEIQGVINLYHALGGGY